MKRTGIVCTIGPRSINLIDQLQKEGMTMARFNGAFGIPAKKIIETISTPILLDIPGKRKKKKLSDYTDKTLIEKAVKIGLSYVGLSYIHSVKEIEEVVPLVKRSKTEIIAKIETREALQNIDEILAHPAVALVMLDRGDLGTAIGFEKIPAVQERLLRKTFLFGKPTIVATEIMMSMFSKTRPHCADVNDIYHAVKQGASYLMVSEETAIGLDPLGTVRTMKKIINFTFESCTKIIYE